ncbi:DNA-binding MarR family transcriptional regulator [Sphingomonas sp. SORGH_AS 950]|uniref:MarR family transcriptional regulator n=1 Tax=Sphingomonas sp. SORGH_AS_0950 TaxID=3041792 RepID=UPI0027829D81|nr:MarR family winged helix-turn-helix transcriptional regulator [Sphingomonas sp. SORGH_AS_0950]MDQ1158905.1 DNA-binding MarR family transcriptional regulator [Sphingomonas sp. SORGH_AS_0950]
MPLADEQDRISVRVELPRTFVEAVILSARRDTGDRADQRNRLARIILKNRQRRQEMFPAVAFGEPAWDMILQIYVADHAGQAVDVSSLCASTGIPKTSALRHLDRLVECGLVRRQPDTVDTRRVYVLPNDALREQTERWLDTMNLAVEIGPP